MCQLTPLFGKESSEPSGRSIPFLSLSHAPLARAQKKVSKAFAAEGAERDALNTPGTGSSGVKKQQSRVTKSKLPFQDDYDESQSQPYKKGRQTSGPLVIKVLNTEIKVIATNNPRKISKPHLQVYFLWDGNRC